MQTLADHATLWIENAVPTRLVWHDERWCVTDTPTPLYTENTDLPPAITHPGYVAIGWRFQATNSAGESRILDVVGDVDGWTVVHAYD